jgi:hypothetical protein
MKSWMQMFENERDQTKLAQFTTQVEKSEGKNGKREHDREQSHACMMSVVSRFHVLIVKHR